MSHLSPERLAAFIDEQPTPAELSHLAGCRVCSQERGAYEALAAMSKTELTIGTPLTTWSRLAPALREDGVIDTGRGFGRQSRMSQGWLRAAAAVLLLVGGAVAGRVTASVGSTVAVANSSTTHLASNETPAFASVEEAQAAAARSQAIYQASMAFLAANDPAGAALSTPAAIKTRLAALDQVTEISRAALEEAPYDSVINTLYLSAQGQKEASIRQLNSGSTRLATY